MQGYRCSVTGFTIPGISDEAQHRARMAAQHGAGALDIELSVVPAKDDEPMQLVQRKSKDAGLRQYKIHAIAKRHAAMG